MGAFEIDGETTRAEPRTRIAVMVERDSSSDEACQAAALAEELDLPLVERVSADFDLVLVVTGGRLELRPASGAVGPVFVDFAGAAMEYRRRFGAYRRSPLAAAVGLRKTAPTVVDATCGLGDDAFFLACLGCAVTAIERHPIVAALVRDALERAARVPALADLVVKHLRLLRGDARQLLPKIAETAPIDVVYLDPMWPRGKKKALPRKDLQLLRLLAGEDLDARELLEVSLGVARRRVVVKRPLHAPPLGGKPVVSYEGKRTRYDVYTLT